MGLKSILHLSIEYIPSRLDFYIVDHFEDEKMILKLPTRDLEITKDTMKQIHGFPAGEIHITQKRTSTSDEIVRHWRSQFPQSKNKFILP